MTFSISSTIEAIVLVIALSTDAFVSGFAYGSNKIKIPFTSVQIINVICTSFLALSLLLGNVIRQYIPSTLTNIIFFCVLFVLGIIKLLDSSIKSIIRNNKGLKKEIKFSFFNLNFVLNLYANPENADIDESKLLSAKEAVFLAIALSLDGLVMGIGAGLVELNILEVIIYSLIFGTAAIMFGSFSGKKIAERVPMNLSWLSGFLLIMLAVLKIF